MKKIIRNKSFNGNCDKNILIIDENLFVVRPIISLLPAEFNEVCYSSNLEDAIQELRNPKNTFNLVISDTELSDAKYIEIPKKIKQVYNGPLALISICGHKDPDFESRVKSFGAVYFPGEISEEIDHIGRYISNLFKSNPPRLS